MFGAAWAPAKKRVGNPLLKAPYSLKLGLLTDAQLLNDGTVAVNLAVLEVVEHPAALTYQFQQAEAGAVVLLVHFQMLREVLNAVGEQSNLRLGRTGIGVYFLKAVFFEDGLFSLGREYHRQIGMTRLRLKNKRNSVAPHRRAGAKVLIFS